MRPLPPSVWTMIFHLWYFQLQNRVTSNGQFPVNPSVRQSINKNLVGENQMSDAILKDAKIRMQKSIESLQRELAGIRTGHANASLLERVTVDYYGAPTP